MTDRELFKMALDALTVWELMQPQTTACAVRIPAIEALRSRLAQPELEPTKLINVNGVLEKAGYIKKKEWVGLTDDEIYEAVENSNSVLVKDMARSIEAKLKEKNT